MILTLATQSLREAIRKKIPHILIALGTIILAISPLISTTNEQDALPKIMLILFFQVVVLLCMIGIILFSAISLPHDIENKTVFSVLSKPVSKFKLVAGKTLGFALLAAFILIVLSLVNIIFVFFASAHLPPEHRGIFKARKEFNAQHFHIQGKIHHQKEGIHWIMGGGEGAAIWNFSRLHEKAKNIPPFEAELRLKFDSSRDTTETILLSIAIEGIQSKENKTEVFSAKADETLTISINPEIIKKNNDIKITVFPTLDTDYIGTAQNNIKVFSIQKGFIFNYAKALAITFLKFLLIIAIAVMGSAYLSALVSILSAFAVFLCGHLLDFIKDFSLLLHHSGTHEHALPGMIKKPNIFMIYMDYLCKKPLEWISFILPDFKKFDGLTYLLKGINIPIETIGFSAGYTLIYVTLCTLISCIILKKREFL
ncbi:MAG: hypothetical protein E3K37_15530 [Candidatus Kuenenia sp.]|nr:hypothetical protein [Candidatus Kuenenia hertensis]